MRKRWHYEGDINLEYGGFYWREMGLPDCVEVVRVTPVSDAGGPNNVFEICTGSISLSPANLKGALSCCGFESANPTRAELVFAFYHYCGIETDETLIVRVGPIDAFWSDGRGGWNPAPDRILRANADLARFVRKEFLK